MELDRDQLEVAQTAARLIVEDGLDYTSARHKAMQMHGEGRRLRDAPDNAAIEDQVREHLSIFHADTQPAELLALRGAALRWMLRLAEFRPELIHNRSGVGSEVLAVDLNKDGAMDVVTATNRGTFIFWGKPTEVKR